MKRLRSTITSLAKRVPRVVWAIFGATLLLTWFLYTQSWSGFRWYIDRTGQVHPAKTLWDWMDLLIIPLVLVIGGFLLNRAERGAERKIADDRNQEAALQNYLDKMTELLLDRKLHGSEPEAEVRDIARARTVTTLRQLDTQRRNILLGFLSQTDLIREDHPVQILIEANLSEANLGRANLIGANLRRADLRQADLSVSVYDDDTKWPTDFTPPPEMRKEP